MIQCNGLTFGYTSARKDALFKSLSITFPKQDIHVIAGPSGTGKSTLLYLISGIYPEHTGFLFEGTLTVDGAALTTCPPQKRAQKVGMLFQNPNMQFTMDTVEHELAFCMENLGVSRDTMESSLADALSFGSCTHLRHRLLQTLSGGEKQRVALACLYLLNPDWILLDEAFANIDPESTRILIQKLLSWKKERGLGIIAIDHQLDHWYSVATTLTLFNPAKEMLLQIPFNALELHTSSLQDYAVIPPHYTYTTHIPVPSETDISYTFENLNAVYGDLILFQNIQLTLRPGTLTALIGPSGGGKTTLLNAVLEASQNIRPSLRVGYIHQNPMDSFVTQRVYDEVRVSFTQKRSVSPQGDATILEILDAVGLRKAANTSPYSLSQGQQRRLGVASLRNAFNILLCDEPTYAQDIHATQEIMDSLLKLAAIENTAILFTTHDHKLAHAYAHSVFHLERGQLREVV